MRSLLTTLFGLWISVACFGARTFNGTTDKIDLGDINALDGLTTLTVSTWIKAETDSPYNGYFFGKLESDGTSAGTNGWGVQRRVSNNQLAIQMASGSWNNYGTVSVSFGEWIHLVVRYDGGESTNVNRVRVWQNGVEQVVLPNGTYPTSLPSITSGLWLGSANEGGGNSGKCSLAEYAVWTVALTEEEIRTLWSFRGFPLHMPRLPALYAPLTRDVIELRGLSASQTVTGTSVSAGAPVYAYGGGSGAIEPPAVGAKYVLAHWMVKIGVQDANVRSIEDYKRALTQAAEAGIDALVVYWDDFDEAGTQQCYEDAMTACEQLLLAGIPTAKLVFGTLGFQDDPPTTDTNYLDFLVANRNREALFRDSDGDVVLSGYYNAWDDRFLDYLADEGFTNVAYWPDQWSGSHPDYAQDAADAGAKGWFRFYHGGIYDWTGWQTKSDADLAQADAASIGYMPPIMVSYIGNQNASSPNWQMFESGGFLGLHEQYEWAMDNDVPAVQIVTFNDPNESSYIQDFGSGGPVQGTDDNPSWFNGLTIDHSGFRKFLSYYNDWFRSGTEPTIASDQVLIAYRLHPRTAVSYSSLSSGEKAALATLLPSDATAWNGGDENAWANAWFTRTGGHEVFTDSVQVCVRLTDTSDVTLSFGSSSQTWTDLAAGQHILSINGATSSSTAYGTRYTFSAAQYGTPRVVVTRGPTTILDKEASLAITAYIVPGNYGWYSEDLTADVEPTYSFFVSPSGSDSNSGLSSSDAFLTLGKARDALRAATGRTTDGVSAPVGTWQGATITLADGLYDLSAAPLILDERDSGTSGAPVTWQAAPGANPIITGAYQVASASWFKIVESGAGAGEVNDSTTWNRLPVAARGKVYRLNVAALGIDKGTIAWGYEDDEGNIASDGNELRPLEDGLPGVMSRWPNASTVDGEDQAHTAWALIKSFTNNPDTIVLEDSGPGAWATSGQQVMVYGCYTAPYNVRWWGGLTLSQSGGDTVISLSEGKLIKPYGMLGGFVSIRNALQALDDPGDYVWNDGAGYLYYWPRSDAAPGNDVSITLARTILDLDESHYVSFDGLTFEGSRNRMVRSMQSEYVSFNDCTFRNFAGKWGGLYAEDATGLTITDSEFTHATQTALRIHGGDRDTLTQAGIEITGTTFNHIGYEPRQAILAGLMFTRVPEPTNPAKSGNACGIRIADCTFTNFRDAIAGSAAYMTFEDNVADGYTTIVGDAGAVGSAFSYATPGLIVRRNTFTNGNRLGYNVGEGSSYGNLYQHQSQGALFTIYLDLAAGAIVEDNLFDDVDHAIIVAGGKDHVIRRNRFNNAGKAHYNAADVVFGSRTGRPHTIPGVPETDLMADLANRPLESSPWPSVYPAAITYRVGGSAHAVRMYHERITFVDNITNKTSIGPLNKFVQYEANTTPATVSGFSVGVDDTQLQYPAGSNPLTTVPVDGGGTVPLSDLDG